MDNFLMSHFCTLLIIINSTIKKIYIWPFYGKSYLRWSLMIPKFGED
jgi:hypothetical protein